MMRRSLGFTACAVFTMLNACSGPAGSTQPEQIGQVDSELQAAASTAPPIPAEAMNAVNGSGHIPDSVLDKIFTFDHFVPVGEGRKIHLRETFSIRSLARFP